MLSAPKVDDISSIWDTRSNECEGPMSERSKEDEIVHSTSGCVSGCKCSGCEKEYVGGDGHFAVPSICDMDVRLVNRYMRQQLKKSN
jgi:hypothetical protein